MFSRYEVSRLRRWGFRSETSVKQCSSPLQRVPLPLTPNHDSWPTTDETLNPKPWTLSPKPPGRLTKLVLLFSNEGSLVWGLEINCFEDTGSRSCISESGPGSWVYGLAEFLVHRLELELKGYKFQELGIRNWGFDIRYWGLGQKV